MEITALVLGFVMLYVQNVDFASGLTLRLLNEKIDYLEAKLTIENKQRHMDYENIMSKLTEITTQLAQRDNKPSDSRLETIEENIAAGGDGTKSGLNMNAQLQYLIKGMIAEKRVNGMTRQKLDEMNNRMKRELSRLDSEIDTSNKIFEKLSHTIEKLAKRIDEQFKHINDKLSGIESKITATNNHIEEYSNTIESFVKHNDEQYANITGSVDVIMTTHNDKCSTIRNELDDTINKQCNFDSIRNLTETSIEQLWTNMSHSFEEMLRQPVNINISSCKDAYYKGYQISGVLTIYNHGIENNVYCDQTTDGGGWTVFQRRMNGEVDFYRNWKSYKEGFGKMTGEFWLGNEYLSAILGRGKHELRIDMEDFEGNRAYAKYSSFRIDPETNHYALHVSGYSGDAGDSLAEHNGQRFSTKDIDLDSWSDSCSRRYKGGWWYNYCHYSNLNGLYHNSSEDNNEDGLVWDQWKGTYYSLKFVELKFR